ncbi:hypothetical protein D3C72_1091780 [compost metagenome]
MRSTFATIFMRLCTIEACEALALKRLMNSSSFASFTSWRLAAASRLVKRCSLSRSKKSKLPEYEVIEPNSIETMRVTRRFMKSRSWLVRKMAPS